MEDCSSMKIYNPGTLIILKNDYDHITYRGIILSLNECDTWWGGGFYNIFWSPTLTPKGKKITGTPEWWNR